MNKVINIIFLICVAIWSLQLLADTEIEINPIVEYHPPLKHDLKTFIDTNNNIFWPVDKPVWIRLAASPEADAQSFLMDNLYEKIDENLTKIENKGIKLDMAGGQFIRWMNFMTKKEMLLKFQADGMPPESSIMFSGAPMFKTENAVVYGKGLNCSVFAKDDLSGVENVYVSVNGAPFVVQEGDLNLDTENRYNIRYYAVDRVGYAGRPESTDFLVDLTPPNTSHNVKDNFMGTTLSLVTRITPESIDKVSGVKDVFYKFESHKKYLFYDPGEGIHLSDLSNGEHILTYFAVDNVNNVEPKKEYKFYLDREPAIITHSLTGDVYNQDSMTFISSRTRIKLTAEDNMAGVKEILYRIGGGQYITYVKPFAPSFNAGKFIVEYRVYDRLGNISPTGRLSLIMDLSAPKTKYALNGPGYVQGGVQWITSATKMLLMASDDQSGIKEISFQVDDEPAGIYGSPISLNKEGRHLLRYWATDNVNNVENFTPALLIVDNTPPKIMEVFSIESVDLSDETSGSGERRTVKVYPVYTTLFLGAMDNSAGLKEISYSLNNGPYNVYRETMMFKEKGSYTINIRAKDHLGNTSSKSIEFIIAEKK